MNFIFRVIRCIAVIVCYCVWKVHFIAVWCGSRLGELRRDHLLAGHFLTALWCVVIEVVIVITVIIVIKYLVACRCQLRTRSLKYRSAVCGAGAVVRGLGLGSRLEQQPRLAHLRLEVLTDLGRRSAHSRRGGRKQVELALHAVSDGRDVYSSCDVTRCGFPCIKYRPIINKRVIKINNMKSSKLHFLTIM